MVHRIFYINANANKEFGLNMGTYIGNRCGSLSYTEVLVIQVKGPKKTEKTSLRQDLN